MEIHPSTTTTTTTTTTKKKEEERNRKWMSIIISFRSLNDIFMTNSEIGFLVSQISNFMTGW